MRKIVRFLSWTLLSAIICESAWDVAQAADQEKSEQGWINLFQGDSLEGWRGKGDSAVGGWLAAGGVSLDSGDEQRLVIEEGTGILVNGPAGRTVNLFTVLEHGDVEAHVEFLVPKGSNSGIYFQGRYEIQILDSYGVKKPDYGDCGGIYQRWKDGQGSGGHAPSTNASRPPGEWQTFDVVFRAPRFDADGKKTENGRFLRVVHNGQVIHENVTVTGPTRAAAFSDEQPLGPLMLQGDHGPVAYRNLRIRHLSRD